LKAITKLPWRQDAKLFDGLQNGDVYIRMSAYLKGLAKIAHDLRLLASGPRTQAFLSQIL
jgi:aspartate ammonia-lyase